MWGAKPPTYWKAFAGLRGRPDLKSAPPKIFPDRLQVPRANGGSKTSSQLGGCKCVDPRVQTNCASHGRVRAPCSKENYVPEGSLAGFLECVFEVWPAPGAREGPQKCGERSPPHIGRPSRASGAGQTLKTHPQKSGQTAFRYPELTEGAKHRHN